eukprot:15482770-Alexandrium_andersonii.AAC.1
MPTDAKCIAFPICAWLMAARSTWPTPAASAMACATLGGGKARQGKARQGCPRSRRELELQSWSCRVGAARV